jgi:hypothetical protein
MSNCVGLTVGQPFNPFGLFTGIFIPEALVKNPDVSPGAKLVYGRLARYAGQDGACYPSVKELGEEVCLGERQTQRYVRELETKRFIRTVPRFKAPNVCDTNDFEFLWHESLAASVKKVKTPPPASGTTPPPASNVTPKESHGEESHLKRSGRSGFKPLGECAPGAQRRGVGSSVIVHGPDDHRPAACATRVANAPKKPKDPRMRLYTEIE